MDLLPLVLIIVGVVVLVAVGYVLRRRRMSAADEIPEIGTPIDYTSQPLTDEPTGWRDRFNNLSVAGKILLILVPLLVIVGGIVIVLALGDGLRSPPTEAPPPAPQYAMKDTSAALANPRQIVVRSSSNLPPDTEVTAELLANAEPFDWFNPDNSSTRVDNNGRFEFRLAKLADAPAASQTVSYTVKLLAEVDGQKVESTVPLNVPPIYAREFYEQPIAAGPTEAAATEAPTAEATTAAEPTTAATAEATPEGPAALTASVFNGGNVRSVPQINGSQVLDQINAGENVQLLQKTPNGQWYLIKNLRNIVGWVSSTLLTVNAEVAGQVPVQGSADPLPTSGALGSTTAEPTSGTPVAEGTPNANGPTARVFNGGNVRSVPQLNGSQVLDQINAGENVQLLQKTANGQWYQIRNVRNIVGWVNVTLLTIDPAVAAKVPVAQ